MCAASTRRGSQKLSFAEDETGDDTRQAALSAFGVGCTECQKSSAHFSWRCLSVRGRLRRMYGQFTDVGGGIGLSQRLRQLRPPERLQG